MPRPPRREKQTGGPPPQLILEFRSDSSLNSEPDALRQRQLGSSVDRARLAAHVSLPGVAAGLASGACIFLAAECAANFRAAGSQVHICNPAIAAAMVEERLGRSEVRSEDGGRKALRHRVVPRDRFFR